jgi:hypothetical protein
MENTQLIIGGYKDGELINLETGTPIRKHNLIHTRFDGIFVELYSYVLGQERVSISLHPTGHDAMMAMEDIDMGSGEVLGIRYCINPQDPTVLGKSGDLMKEIKIFLQNNLDN